MFARTAGRAFSIRPLVQKGKPNATKEKGGNTSPLKGKGGDRGEKKKKEKKRFYFRNSRKCAGGGREGKRGTGGGHFVHIKKGGGQKGGLHLSKRKTGEPQNNGEIE